MNSSRRPFLSILWFLSFTALQSFAAESFKLKTRVQHASLWSEPSTSSKRIGKLVFGSNLDALSSESSNHFYHVRVFTAGQNPKWVEGWVESRDVEKSASAAKSVAEEPADETNELPDPHRWSLGAGFGGYSVSNKTQVTITGEIRYKWTRVTETVSGVDLSFGSSAAFGLRLAERFYAPVSHTFVPYLHTGYRISNVARFDTSAWDLGGGFQVIQGGGSYFEVGVNYLMAKPFNDSGDNAWVFGGSSGFRF